MSDKKTEETVTAADPTRKRLTIVVSVLAAVLVVLLGVLVWQLYIGPQRAAQTALDSAAANRGEITAVNTDLVAFEGQKIENANSEQKGLAVGDELTSPPAFIFTNGKDIADRKVVDFYFDFADQRSRDALIANSISLSSLVESGQIELRLHPLFGGRAYSMYASEALSEVFAANPDLAWDSLMTLLRNAPALVSIDSNDEMVKSIVAILKTDGVTAVDEQSIKNGTFAGWLLSIGNDPQLKGTVAPKLPYILADGTPLNLSVDQLNDPDAFKRAVIRGVQQ